MADAIASMCTALLVALGLHAGIASATGAGIGVAALAVLVAAAIVLLQALAGSSTAARDGGTAASPERGIDISASLAQSDPDAAGHTRSRAPGFTASAA